MKPTNHDPQLLFTDAPAPAATGRKLRDKAMKKVAQHSAPGFSDAADLAVERAALALESLTADDVWKHMPGAAKTHDNRAMGPAMTRAKGRGVIEPTDRFRATDNPNGHAGPRRIWRSLIFVGPEPR